jgi:ribonuclease BN (tRNA processing enzyme)
VRLTVLGTGTAQPQPDGPASGLLLESGETALLLDCGTGAVSRLRALMDPRDLTAVLIGHLHGDHSLDLVPLRYLFPWIGGTPRPLPVYLPPGGAPRLDALAEAISERRGFFQDAFDVAEYQPEAGPLRLGELEVLFRRARHYVPAWSMRITAPDGASLAYLGDTGPSDSLVEFARGADLVICEATLRSAAEDDVERGHLTPGEAIDMIEAAGAGRGLIVHHPTSERPAIATLCAERGSLVTAATPGLVLEVAPAVPSTKPAA